MSKCVSNNNEKYRYVNIANLELLEFNKICVLSFHHYITVNIKCYLEHPVHDSRFPPISYKMRCWLRRTYFYTFTNIWRQVYAILIMLQCSRVDLLAIWRGIILSTSLRRTHNRFVVPKILGKVWCAYIYLLHNYTCMYVDMYYNSLLAVVSDFT